MNAFHGYAMFPTVTLEVCSLKPMKEQTNHHVTGEGERVAQVKRRRYHKINDPERIHWSFSEVHFWGETNQKPVSLVTVNLLSSEMITPHFLFTLSNFSGKNSVFLFLV